MARDQAQKAEDQEGLPDPDGQAVDGAPRELGVDAADAPAPVIPREKGTHEVRKDGSIAFFSSNPSKADRESAAGGVIPREVGTPQEQA